MNLFYYITDRAAFPGDEPTRRRALLEKIAEAARSGVDYIQLREKDLATCDLESLAREAIQAVVEATRSAPRERSQPTALIINSRTDVAMAVRAQGVHLRTVDVSPQEVRAAWRIYGAGALARGISLPDPIVAVSCHSTAEVTQAAANAATFAVFAPIFEKKDVPGARPAGLAQLQEACRARIPVLALGGVNLYNARLCLEAGAAGIAAIRLFQENDIAYVIRALH